MELLSPDFSFSHVLVPLLRFGMPILRYALAFGLLPSTILVLLLLFTFWYVGRRSDLPLWLVLPFGTTGGMNAGLVGLTLARYGCFHPDWLRDGQYAFVWVTTVPFGMVLGAATGCVLVLRRFRKASGIISLLGGLLTAIPLLILSRGEAGLLTPDLGRFPLPWSLFLTGWGIYRLVKPSHNFAGVPQ
jgi:hypothetical protein